MEKSQSITELAKALNQFQSEVDSVKKDGTNPYFKSKYATLENTIETIKTSLVKAGLSFSQLPSGLNGLTTILMHTSGEWLQSTVTMTPKDNTPQGQGSAITYMRRYALSALLGLATEEDDDGNSASTSKKEVKPSYPKEKVVSYADEPPFEEKPNIKSIISAQIKTLRNDADSKNIKQYAKELTGMDLVEVNYEDISARLNDLIIESREK